LGIPQNLIPYVTQTAAGIREELSVFGDDYNTQDGTAIRDYIHVVDLAKAHIAALKRLIDKTNKENFEFFNIGTGKGSSVLDVIKTFEKITKKPLNYKIVGRREGDITAAFADTTIANRELQWKTEKSLEEALEAAWKWQQQNGL
jgi:UDP-glucose 4-epimerase